VPGSGFEHGPHHSDPSIVLQGVSQRGFRRGRGHLEVGKLRGRARSLGEEREAMWQAGSVQRQPNMRMKLTARGGRLKRKRPFLSAATTGCSLCAIR
jgi:hypothetical protein